jgi:hypothetical protein
MSARPIYVVRLRARPGVDAIKALRASLKILGRRFGPQALEVRVDLAANDARVSGGTNKRQ